MSSTPKSKASKQPNYSLKQTNNETTKKTTKDSLKKKKNMRPTDLPPSTGSTGLSATARPSVRRCVWSPVRIEPWLGWPSPFSCRRCREREWQGKGGRFSWFWVLGGGSVFFFCGVLKCLVWELFFVFFGGHLGGVAIEESFWCACWWCRCSDVNGSKKKVPGYRPWGGGRRIPQATS